MVENWDEYLPDDECMVVAVELDVMNLGMPP